MNNIHYLDHASSSYPTKFFAKDYYIPGNSNSIHTMGIEANKTLNEARQRIMKCLNVKSGKVLFGGTASQLINNLMWRIYSLGNYEILGSIYEHEAVNKWLDYKTSEFLKHNLDKNDIICHMAVNNITGFVFPVEKIGKLCREIEAYYIMDCVAAIGHYPINYNLESFCDCIIASAHKFHGPQGSGFMWISDRFANFLGLSNDSHEEYGLISGTPDVSSAIATSFAFEYVTDRLTFNNKNWEYLLEYLKNKLTNNNIQYKFVCNNGCNAITAIQFYDINADALVNFLSSRNIYISPGHSACSNTGNETRVLEAFGLTKQEASEVVRISFSEDTETNDIDALVKGIIEFKEMFI